MDGRIMIGGRWSCVSRGDPGSQQSAGRVQDAALHAGRCVFARSISRTGDEMRPLGYLLSDVGRRLWLVKLSIAASRGRRFKLAMGDCSFVYLCGMRSKLHKYMYGSRVG